jgi:hypothetical protein
LPQVIATAVAEAVAVTLLQLLPQVIATAVAKAVAAILLQLLPQVRFLKLLRFWNFYFETFGIFWVFCNFWIIEVFGYF